jgi:hypothetical protein
MKIIHYSRHGYNGNLTYTSVCGKKVKTHQDKEETSIHPEQTTCKKCAATNEFRTDMSDFKNTQYGIKRRIYIESDILDAMEFRSAQNTVENFVESFGLKCVDRVFSDVLDFAWHDLETTWKAVKAADEIYATSSLMPLIGNSYMGAPVIFNGMCERAIKENVTGKSVFILNNLKSVYWDMIDMKLMKQAFKHNDLFMYNDEYKLEAINVQKIKK